MLNVPEEWNKMEYNFCLQMLLTIWSLSLRKSKPVKILKGFPFLSNLFWREITQERHAWNLHLCMRSKMNVMLWEGHRVLEGEARWRKGAWGEGAGTEWGWPSLFEIEDTVIRSYKFETLIKFRKLYEPGDVKNSIYIITLLNAIGPSNATLLFPYLLSCKTT